MNAIILKGAALRQPPLPQSGPRAKTIAHPWSMRIENVIYLINNLKLFFLLSSYLYLKFKTWERYRSNNRT
jgi:hypothetical protein